MDRTKPSRPPQNPTEEALLLLVARELGRDAIGVEDNFFEIGGDSIHAMRILHGAQRAFGAKVSMARFFDRPDLAHLAKLIVEASGLSPQMDTVSLAIGSRSDRTRWPLSSAQTRLWYTQLVSSDRSILNVAGAIRLRGALDVGALQRALRYVIDRHETLRAQIEMVNGEPVQVVLPALNPVLVVDEFAAAAGLGEEEWIHRRFQHEVAQPFDLSCAPLFRSRLLRVATNDHVLLLNLHHVISDGWSQGVLLHDLAHAYNAFLADIPPELPELSVQFADFAAWEQDQLTPPLRQALRAYWQAHLAGVELVLRLPCPARPIAGQGEAGATLTAGMPEFLTARLRAVCTEQNVTPFMVVLSAYGLLLSRRTGQEKVVVGFPTANREHGATEALVGCFVNMLPVCVDVSGNPSGQLLLTRTRKAVTGALEHRALPFSDLVDAVRPKRDGVNTPVFQVVCLVDVLQDAHPPFAELQSEPLELYAPHARYNLVLRVLDRGGILSYALTYKTQLWNEIDAQHFMEEYLELLAAMLESPLREAGVAPMTASTRRDVLGPRQSRRKAIAIEANRSKDTE